jgi:hypothetical protein
VRARMRIVVLGSAVALGVLAGPAAGSALANFTVTVTAPATEGNPGDTPHNVVVQVTRTGLVPLNSATATVTPSDGTAKTPADYDGRIQSLAWNALETGSKSVDIPIVPDALHEGDETFTVTVTVTGGETVSNGVQEVTIKDDDPAPTMSVGDASVTEGTGTSTTMTFPVTLSAVSGVPAKAHYATTAGTATSGDDFTPTSGDLTIPAGSTTGSISVPIIGDNLAEDDETFTVTLSALDQATAGRLTATGTIHDNDTPVISIASVTQKEGNSGTTVFSFPVTLSNPSTKTVTVDYATSDVQATAPSDYAATSGTVTFAPGEVAKTIDVAVVGDTVVEPNETFAVTLANPANAVLSTSAYAALGGIVNDDVATTSPGGGGGGGASSTVPDPGVIGGAANDPLSLHLKKLRLVRRGVVKTTLTCPLGTEACNGKLTVFSVPNRTSRVRALRREVRLGAVNFAVAPGQSGTITLRLSKRARSLLAQARRIAVRGYAVARAANGRIGTASAGGVLRAG